MLHLITFSLFFSLLHLVSLAVFCRSLDCIRLHWITFDYNYITFTCTITFTFTFTFSLYESASLACVWEKIVRLRNPVALASPSVTFFRAPCTRASENFFFCSPASAKYETNFVRSMSMLCTASSKLAFSCEAANGHEHGQPVPCESRRRWTHGLRTNPRAAAGRIHMTVVSTHRAIPIPPGVH